jgi:hypothetical protein
VTSEINSNPKQQTPPSNEYPEPTKPNPKLKNVSREISSSAPSAALEWDPNRKVARERLKDARPGARGDHIPEETPVMTMYQLAKKRAKKRHLRGSKRIAISVDQRKPVKSPAVGQAVIPGSKPEAQKKIEMFGHILICKEKDELLKQLKRCTDPTSYIDAYKMRITSRLKDSKSHMEFRLLDTELRQIMSWPKTGPEAFKAARDEYMDQFILLSTYPQEYQKMSQTELIHEIKLIENFYEHIGNHFPEYFDLLQNEEYYEIPSTVMSQYDELLSAYETNPRIAPIISQIRSNPNFSFHLEETSEEYHSDDEGPGSEVGLGLLCLLYMAIAIEAGSLSELETNKSKLQRLLDDNQGTPIIQDAISKCDTLIQNFGKPEFTAASESILKQCEALKTQFQTENPKAKMPHNAHDLIEFLEE